MNDVDTPKGNIVIGATLVLTGLAVVLERAGVLHWSDRWTLWPLILGGIGLARLLQTAPGEPKQGLLFLTAAVWLFLGEAGWVSFESSWPIVVIVVGLIIALNGGTRRRWGPPLPGESADQERRRRHRRPDYPLSALAAVGVWIAVFVALQVSGIRSFSQVNQVFSGGDGDRVRIVSVMGRGEHISPATAFRGADVTNVMGRANLDLREAQLAPGAEADVHIFSAMGAVVLRVPPTWTVDTGTISTLGTMRDDRPPVPDRDATAGPPPRLVLRGLVMMGRLTITS